MALLEAPAPVLLERPSCTYTSCYCEENVYKLVETLAAPPHAIPLRDLFVTFVSNPPQKVVLWEQRAGNPAADGVIIWDYHVILLQHTGGGQHQVWDLDTLLPFPVPFGLYCQGALRPDTMAQHVSPALQRRYRVVPAADYLRHFASDRSHMVKDDGSWNAPPPPYPCIAGEADDAPHNLPQYLDMSVAGDSGDSSSSGGGSGGGGGGGGGGDDIGGQHMRPRFGQVLLEVEFVARFSGAAAL